MLQLSHPGPDTHLSSLVLVLFVEPFCEALSFVLTSVISQCDFSGVLKEARN